MHYANIGTVSAVALCALPRWQGADWSGQLRLCSR